MKVILTQDIKNVGKKGQLMEVSDGYARNFLFPKKCAIEATKSNMNELQLKQKSEDHKKEKELKTAEDLGKKLAESKVQVAIKTGGNGKAFGSVTSKEIAKAMEDQLKLSIDKKKIVLSDPIRILGTYQVSVKIHPQVTAQLEVNIVGE
jgi:large subunit ribosomal protein L9